MKNKIAELDVDYIQSRPLTKKEEKKLSEFIKKLKDKKTKSSSKKAAQIDGQLNVIDSIKFN